MPDWTLWALLALVVVLSHLIETVLGFGATLVALALGVHLLPLDQLLVLLVLLGMVQSVWLLVTGRRHVDWNTILFFILPAATLGLFAGMLYRDLAPEREMKVVLGLFVIGVAMAELYKWKRSGHRAEPPMTRTAGIPVLFGGGVFHGLFASGGPLIVYYASRALPSRKVFRASLAVLWLLLNLMLVAQLWGTGNVTMQSGKGFLILLPAAFVGIAIGERVRISERVFRLFTYLLLLVAGVLLVA